ncbi:MAG: hypothetical protein F6K65_10265 [Moorea sp. SIO3C2]|nr:hypothetical protein [Moorena sp. SIO3C2]
MQDKQKVTLYLPPGLHRRLKIKAAVDSESMSAMVERAILFYIEHQDVVEEVDQYGQTHKVYPCPECYSDLVLSEGKLVALKNQPGVISEELPVEKVTAKVCSRTDSQGEEELVPC